MRALSLGLIRGNIDQVEQFVHVSWVKPRVLGREVIPGLIEQVTAWELKTETTQRLMEDETTGLLMNL